MTKQGYTLAFRPTGTRKYGGHDPSAALFKSGKLVFAAEEERFTRNKHALDTFPEQSIRAALDYEGISIGEVDKIHTTFDLSLTKHKLPHDVGRAFRASSKTETIWRLERIVEGIVDNHVLQRISPFSEIKARLREIGSPVPPIEAKPHHACHAASAFHLSSFDEALVVTLDGRGEFDSTVIWHGTPDGLDRLRTYKFPNSLGRFFGGITEYLGFRRKNGEGKVMGLAPYGGPNEDVRTALRELVTGGIDYDVTPLTRDGYDVSVEKLERLFERPRNQSTEEFDQFGTDLAFAAQRFIEDCATSIVEHYIDILDVDTVCLAGGVALNCKLNQQIRKLDGVESIFIQPAANDAGLAVGAGILNRRPIEVDPMETAAYGRSYETETIRKYLEEYKIPYRRPTNLIDTVAERLADGEIVGWFQGRMEFGPRALGHRSILADPRTAESRDRVNDQVKHRENWRPFAPSILEERAAEYLEDDALDPFMITTFDVRGDKAPEIPAVLHPADETTRPQTVNRDESERYWRLIRRFEEITGVPVLLNTSLNDHGEPIVEHPRDALQSFYTMGIDFLVLEEILVEKTPDRSTIDESG